MHNLEQSSAVATGGAARHAPGEPSSAEDVHFVLQVSTLLSVFHLIVLTPSNPPRYDLPTFVAPSATLPITSPLNPLPHLFSLASSPLPRHLAIRRLHPAESPKLSTAAKAAEWEAVTETLAATGRWKRTGLDWEAKEGFLEYRAKRK